MSNQKKSKKKWLLLLLLLLLLFVVVGLYLFFTARTEENRIAREQFKRDSLAQYQAQLDSINNQSIADSIAQEVEKDSLETELARLNSLQIEQDHRDSVEAEQARRDSIVNSPDYRDSVREAQRIRDSLKIEQELRDSLEQLRADSTATEQARQDSITANTSTCTDSIAPWIYPEPTGGLHYEPVNVTFVSNEPSTIFWKFSDESTFREWDGSKINISSDEELHYYAIDSCENVMEQNNKKYVFKQNPSDGRCPQSMTFVENSENGFCIDKYEWPNKRGSTPTSNVSFTEASDSCFIAGKRLCTNNEWESACSGKYDWDYPYGQTYEQHACVTLSNRRRRSGDAGECRGWYEVYDMVGNLAEWTSTPSERDSKFFIVKGGFWESGNRGTCSLKRYSYYPQNRHNPVGFRCCKNSEN